MKNITIGLMLRISCLLAAAAASSWVQTITKGNKNITKFHFYVHNLDGGPKFPNTTVYGIANASITSTSPTNFGHIDGFDDRVTAEADINSEQVARVQGTAAYAGLQAFVIALNMNFYITSGEFNRSTLGMAGHITAADRLREVPMIGGTGAFRLARGYADSSIYSIDLATGYSVLEYKIYVIAHSDEVVWTGA
ncbi:dirigent protein 21-like [Salvia divinorum]|uniref:Dirigent protein n=1 Tax=Salvia divinorum TaxID=28513 RepID=A0ABD1GBP3_SALDI